MYQNLRIEISEATIVNLRIIRRSLVPFGVKGGSS